MRYREGLKPVLQGLDLSLRAGEKVGLVGRTGAGKSSILVCLYRIVELSAGRITIDGRDIAHANPNPNPNPNSNPNPHPNPHPDPHPHPHPRVSIPRWEG